MERAFLHLIFTLIIWLPASLVQGIGLGISPEFIIASGVTPANSDTMNPGKPGVGFDGTNYLVVTCREDISSDYLIGVMVSKDGAVVTTFPIADLNPVYGCGRKPAVSFDGSNYLVVFPKKTSTGSTNIVGVRITPAGDVLDSPSGFTILTGISVAADIAFNGSNYLVVSARYNSNTLHDVIGARVNTDGLVLDELDIFTAPGSQVSSSLASDGNNYMVIWKDNSSGSSDADLYGTRISPGGGILDKAGIPISTALGYQEWSDIIFDGNNYFVVWQDTRHEPGANPPVLDIYGTRISPNGVLLDGPPDSGGIAIATYPRSQTHPVISFDGTNYFVTWEASSTYNPPVGIYAARVAADGVLIDGPPNAGGILISQPSCSSCKLVFPNSLFSGDNIILAWVNNSGTSGTTKDVVGVLVTSSDVASPANCYQLDLRGTWMAYGVTGDTFNKAMPEAVRCKIKVNSSGSIVGSTSYCKFRSSSGVDILNNVGGNMEVTSKCVVTGKLRFCGDDACTSLVIEHGTLSTEKDVLSIQGYLKIDPDLVFSLTGIKR